MSLELSKKNITSYRGDVLPLHLGFDSEQHSALAKADISWKSDSDAVLLRTFEGEQDTCFNNGVLLILRDVGSANVTAEYDGVEYTCSVTVREINSANSDDELNFYVGDLHNHTTQIHNPDEFINRTSGFQSDFIECVGKENLLDLCAITDHAIVLNDTEFFRQFLEVENNKSSVIFFPGAESEVTVMEDDRFGVAHKKSGEMVTLNTAGYISSNDWDSFCKCNENSPRLIGIFAHPSVVGIGIPGIWDFCFEQNNTDEMRRMMRGIEVINGRALSENLLHEFNYSLALDNGFKVSPVASCDLHGPFWGYNAAMAKTVILAKEKSRESFVDALRNNRFYATESGNVKLKYKVNGKCAPCVLDDAKEYKFHVELSYFKNDEDSRCVECSVISDGGKTLKRLTDFASSFDFAIESDTARYFYLRFVDKNGRRTWSMPVWTGRLSDEKTSTELKPIDLKNATAIDVLTNDDASVLIDGNVYNSWEVQSGKASVVIDLKEVREVCALGCYPRVVIRPSRKNNPEAAKNWRESDYTSAMPSEYEIYTSVDGKNYEKKTDGVIRVFGRENIIEFEKTSARYVRFDVLSTVGDSTVPKTYGNSKCALGNLALFG